MRETEDVVSRLEAIAEELADKALDALRSAADAHDPAERDEYAAAERRFTRARRSVEKAAVLLQSGDAPGTVIP